MGAAGASQNSGEHPDLHRPASSPCASSWLLLAVWLAFWPAFATQQAALRADAQARRSVVAEAVHGCCCATPTAPAGEKDDARGGCEGPLGSPARAPSCPDGGASRCSQCVGCGALPLLAHAALAPDPELTVVGSLPEGDHVAASRNLRPPVPPPRTAGEFPFA